MCQEKVRWAVGLPLTDRTVKLVMIQLCDAWTATDGCFPSVKRLAERCVCSERSVQRALRRLEIVKLIGRQFGARTTRYLLNFDWVSPVTLSVTPVTTTPVTNLGMTGDTGVTPGVTPTVTLTIEPEEEPSPLTTFGECAREEQPEESNNVSRETIEADSDKGTPLGLDEPFPDDRATGEAAEPDARGSPDPARNGRARRARDRQSPAQLTLIHAAEIGLLAPQTPLKNGTKTNGRSNGCRISRDWWPEAAEVEFAQGLKLDVARIVPEFIDYWIAVSGRFGVKQDWAATFRNRCRTLADRGVGRAPAGAVQAPRGNGAFYDELAVIAREARERDRDLG